MRNKDFIPKAPAKTNMQATKQNRSIPQILRPLKAVDARPTEQERKIIKEMYDWERQSANVQFRVG